MVDKKRSDAAKRGWVTRKNRARAKKGWATRRRREAERERIEAEEAERRYWEAYYAEQERLAAEAEADRRRRSAASKRGWEKRRAREAGERRSAAARKGWETRRRREEAAKTLAAPPTPAPSYSPPSSSSAPSYMEGEVIEPESFDDWWTVFNEGIEGLNEYTRAELEERVDYAPTDEAREAAEDDLTEFEDALANQGYSQDDAFQEMVYLAGSPDEWSRVQDAYEQMTGSRHKLG